MAFDVNNFVIDHVLRGVMTSSADGSVMWSINQITEPSLSVTTETAEAVDALGAQIASFDRAKNAEFSANNSMFDLGLYAAQNGNVKEVAGGNVETIVTPAFETIEVKKDETSVTLKHTPNAQIKEIYGLKGDGTLGVKYTLAEGETATTFIHAEGSNTITIPTGLAVGSQLFVMYEYEATSAVAVTGDAINFPKAGKFIMEVLGTDVCDPTTLIHAYIVFPNAKLDANVDVSFTTDGNHPFTLRAQQAYCDSKKKLFSIIIPEEV